MVSLSNALNIRAADGDLSIEPFVDVVPEDPAELAEVRREALTNPIYAGNIVSNDGGVAALLVYLMDIEEREFLARGIDREIRRIADEEKGDASVWITGPAYVKAEMSRTLLSDLIRTVPLAALGLILVSFLSFRTLIGSLIPLITVGVALVWTLAVFAATGRSLNVITVVLPPLILVVGFAYSVHVVAEYYEVLRRLRDEDGGSNEGVVLEALRHVALPVVLTGATTAAGFLSLVASPLGAIKQFGLFATMGVVLTMAVSLSFAPALLCVLPRPRRAHSGVRADWFDRLARRVAQFDVRRRIPILVGAAVIAVISLLGISRIEISTDVIRLFDPEAQVRRDFEAINEKLEGSDALYVVVSTDYRDAFKEPVNLKIIEDLQHWLEAQPEIGGTTSLVDYLKLIHKGFYDND